MLGAGRDIMSLSALGWHVSRLGDFDRIDHFCIHTPNSKTSNIRSSTDLGEVLAECCRFLKTESESPLRKDSHETAQGWSCVPSRVHWGLPEPWALQMPPEQSCSTLFCSTTAHSPSRAEATFSKFLLGKAASLYSPHHQPQSTLADLNK